MKQLLLICAVVALVGCHAGNKKNASKAKAIAEWKVIQAAIRKAAKKPTGELTKADLEKVTRLELRGNQLTDVKHLEKITKLEWLDLNHNQLTSLKGLEKLTQLKELYLSDSPDLTKAQIDELQKGLPKCDIFSNPTK